MAKPFNEVEKCLDEVVRGFEQKGFKTILRAFDTKVIVQHGLNQIATGEYQGSLGNVHATVILTKNEKS